MSHKIVDEFSDLKVSRERKRQLRMSAQGLCYRCKGPLGVYASLCDKCLRETNGDKPWKRGSPGRPPKRLCVKTKLNKK